MLNPFVLVVVKAPMNRACFSSFVIVGCMGNGRGILSRLSCIVYS